MAKKKTQSKKTAQNEQKTRKKGASVQDLIGIKTFTDYGIVTNRGELLYYLVTPTNISVLSAANIENKIRQLKLVLSTETDIEITVTDSSECFDDNKLYLKDRIENEHNLKVRGLLEKDITFLDGDGASVYLYGTMPQPQACSSVQESQ